MWCGGRAGAGAPRRRGGGGAGKNKFAGGADFFAPQPVEFRRSRRPRACGETRRRAARGGARCVGSAHRGVEQHQQIRYLGKVSDVRLVGHLPQVRPRRNEPAPTGGGVAAKQRTVPATIKRHQPAPGGDAAAPRRRRQGQAGLRRRPAAARLSIDVIPKPICGICLSRKKCWARKLQVSTILLSTCNLQTKPATKSAKACSGNGKTG